MLFRGFGFETLRIAGPCAVVRIPVSMDAPPLYAAVILVLLDFLEFLAHFLAKPCDWTGFLNLPCITDALFWFVYGFLQRGGTPDYCQESEVQVVPV